MAETLVSLLLDVLEGQRTMERKVDRLLARHGDERYLAEIALDVIAIQKQLAELQQLVGTAPVTATATHAVLIVNQGEVMPGSITVDTTNETVTLQFVDDKGDVATGPDGVVVTFASDNTSVATVATDSANALQGDVTPVGIGTANLSATLANADGSAVLEADGVTPFPTPASVAVTVSAGAAVGDSLVLSV